MYILTENNLTILIAGKPVTVPSTHKQYEAIKETVLAGGDPTSLLTIPKVYSEFTGGRVKVEGRNVSYLGQPLHGGLADKIAEFVAAEKPELAEPLCRFLDRVQQNPSYRAVQGLFNFVQATKLPIASDGRVIAWKIIKDDYRDIYSGKFDNSVGKIVAVPRNSVDENPDQTCSYGLHVCSEGYLPHYGDGLTSRVVMVAVDPADFVAVPADYSNAKARVCKYEVIAEVPRDQAATYFTREDYVVDFETWGEREPDSDDDDGEYIGNIVLALDEDLLKIETDLSTYTVRLDDERVFDTDWSWSIADWRSLHVSADGLSVIADDFSVSLATIKAHDIG